MSYKYDIFISYKRNPDTKKWIDIHFIPSLERHLEEQLGRRPTCFVDSNIQAGTDWRGHLSHALGNSKIIIILWSQSYLTSEWCTYEVAHMMEREVRCGFRTIEKPDGIIFPVIIHGGDTLPTGFSPIQKLEIQDCFNLRMSMESPKARILDDKLNMLSKQIARAIGNVPDWQPQWQEETDSQLFPQFKHNFKIILPLPKSSH